MGPVGPPGPVAPIGPDRTGVFPDITLKTRLISVVRPEKFADKTGVVLISIERRSIKFRYRTRFTGSGSGFLRRDLPWSAY
jgi:hypothetical protein